MELLFKVFGEQAKELCKAMNLQMTSDANDINRKVWFFYEPVEGHPVVEVQIEV
jgi:hypothetical protein